MQAKFIPVLVAVGCLVACENPQEQKKKAEAIEQQQKAIDAMRVAPSDVTLKEVGDPEKFEFSDGSTVKSYKNFDYAANRDLAVKAAIDKVSALTDLSATQKVMVNRSLSNLYFSRANYQIQAAMADWADLTARSASLVSDAVQLENAVTRAQSLSVDNSGLIATLRDNQASLDKEVRDLQEKQAALEKEVADLSQTVSTSQARNRELLDSGRKLRADALLLKGAAQYETYKGAIKAESDAAQALFQAQRAAAKLDVVASEKKIVETKLNVIKPAAATLAERMAAAERRLAETRRNREEAMKARDVIVQRLRDNFAKIAGERETKVVTRFRAAHELTDKSLAAIKAANDAPGDSPSIKRFAAVELVSRHVANSYLATQELATMVSYGKSLEQLATQVSRSMPEMTLFAENAKTVKDAAGIQVKDAKAAIAAAQELASKLVSETDGEDPYVVVDGPGQTHNLAAEAVAQLQSYDKRVDELRTMLGLP